MAGLTGSSSKIFAENKTSRAFLSSGTLSNGPRKCFFLCPKIVCVDFVRSSSLNFKAIESLRSSCLPTETQVGWETADDQAQATLKTANDQALATWETANGQAQATLETPNDQAQATLETPNDQAQATSPSESVHIKFQLQKECAFGERFLLVGDDPSFGSWDLSSAIPMEWSDGHIWTVELDLPVGKSVQFKFVLEGNSGEVFWQPGPDRLVKTWKTENTIIVSEDWENAEIQKITEEPIIISIMKSVATENLPYPNVEGIAEEKEIVAENISSPEKEPISSASSELIDSEYATHPKEDHVVISGNTLIITKKGDKLIVSENINHTKEYTADLDKGLQTSESITYPVEGNTPSANDECVIVQSTPESNGGTIISKNENQGVIYEGGPVLVPGLAPLQTMATQHSSSQLVGEGNNSNAPLQVDEAEGNSAPTVVV